MFQHARRAAICGALLLLAASRLEADRREWTRAESDHFTVAGTLGSKEIRESVDRLEAFRRALSVLIPAARLDSPVPQQVVLLESQSRLRPFVPAWSAATDAPRLGGYFLPSPDINHFVVAQTADASALQTLFHEYTHWAVYRTFGSLIPAWVNEGLAELYSRCEIHAGNTRATIDVPPNRSAALRSGRWIPLQQIVSPAQGARLLSSARTAQLFSAESWALAHYFLIGARGGRSARLFEYVELVSSGVPADTAFERAFRTTPDKLQDALRGYLAQPILPVTSVQVPEDPRPRTPRVDRMSEQDALRLQGVLFARLGKAADAERVLGEALALDQHR